MNKYRLVIGGGVLLVALLVFLLPVHAAHTRALKGDFYFEIPTMEGDSFQVWMNIDVQEANDLTHKAIGPVDWHVYHPALGEATVSAKASCLLFGEDIGADPNSVILISHIKQSTGWSTAKLGEYAYWWLKDGSSGADQFSVQYYDFANGIEFFPRGKPPTCAYFYPDFVFDVLEGDIAISH